MMIKQLFACCFPVPRFHLEKKDACTQVNGTDFYVRNATENSELANEKWQNTAVATNPFANMSINPCSNNDGLFPNPFFGGELLEDLQKPFLDKNEKLLLMNTGKSWIPLLSSSPFFNDGFEDGSICILNPSDDPMKNVPQPPMDYKIHCQLPSESQRRNSIMMVFSKTALFNDLKMKEKFRRLGVKNFDDVIGRFSLLVVDGGLEVADVSTFRCGGLSATYEEI
ncbi:hypothetical protein AVEN_200690-1 [Araneus ventricosus]|uniref:Uncharacterized protein n=1 Tax=Araneus ventricosus TaxID=182803 RepID=A0A4Y2M0D6_ARAVE|nr:hypothetical protein AVEN_200690-1 [Araneus ventricosus]